MHGERLGVGVAEAEQAGGDEQQAHEDDAAGLGHVAAQGGDDEDDELGGGLEVAVGAGLGAQPRRRRDGLQVVGHAAQADGAPVAQVHEVLRQHVADVGVGRQGLRRRGALLDDPDVEDAREHQGEEECYSVPWNPRLLDG